MHRVPQIPLVHWGGLPPHLEAARGKGATELITGRASRMDDYQKNLEITRSKQNERISSVE